MKKITQKVSLIISLIITTQANAQVSTALTQVAGHKLKKC